MTGQREGDGELANTTKHGKSGKGHRQNKKLILKDLMEKNYLVKVTIEGKRQDVEKVLWNMKHLPREWT